MIPITYADANVGESFLNPSAVNVDNVRLTAFYRRYLLQKAMSVFKWEFPESWKHQSGADKYFLYSLYVNGVVAVINTDRFGVIPQHATVTGRNVFYQPHRVLVSNPLLQGTRDLVIGQDCTIFSLESDYGGIMDIVNHYAALMSLVSESLSINTLNSRLSYVFAAGDKNMAESMKKAADKVLSGRPYVVVDDKLFNGDGSLRMTLFEQNLAGNFIAPELMTLLQNIEDQFATDIGLPNANTQKRERLITSEVDSNRAEVKTRSDMWLEDWRKSCEDTRDMFGIDISVDWRIDPEGGASDD